MLAAADVFVGAAIGVAVVVSSGASAAVVVGTALAGGLLAKLLGLYDADHRAIRHLTSDELQPLAGWALGLTLATIIVVPQRLHAIEALLIAAAGLALAVATRSVARHLWRRWTPLERTLVLGAGEPARAIERKIELFDDLHLELVGAVTPSSLLRRSQADAFDAFGKALTGIDRIVLAWQEADPA